MKCFLSFFLLMFFFAFTVSAIDFVPSVMKISSSPTISYKFDGSELKIPVTVSGTNALGQFLVFTKDNAESIDKVQNGFLGWHTVNKIDTCVYVSLITEFPLGSNTITWDGKDTDGGVLPPGEYTYYIWGYDNISTRYPMSNSINVHAWVRPTILTHAEDGTPLSNPIVYSNNTRAGETDTDTAEHENKKWVVGGDPDDETLLETCMTRDGTDIGGLYFDPKDLNYFFKDTLSSVATSNKIIRKWQWVPNGAAVLQTDWGDDGEFSFSGAWPAGWHFGPGVEGDGKELLFNINGDISGEGSESELIYIDINDGTEIKRVDLSEWYVSLEDAEKGGQASGGPTDLFFRHGILAINSHSSCLQMVANPHFEDEEDFILWLNDNGDYQNDKNFEVDAERPWVCNDYNSAPMPYNNVLDDNLLVITQPAASGGGVSFSIFAPDGTGLGSYAYADQGVAFEYGIHLIDYDSAYDGQYNSNRGGGDEVTNILGWNFVAYNSFSGIITSAVGVENKNPAAFSVAQNSPNPFNPTTTISFTTAESGNVSMDVYNVAGQKVDTIVNEFMGTGSHSVTWDASGFSAGVYFYTVKSGEISKTMKMTLLK